MPQKDTLDRAAYTCMLVSYRRLSSQFQFSLSGVTLVYCISMAQTWPNVASIIMQGSHHVIRINLCPATARPPEIRGKKVRNVDAKILFHDEKHIYVEGYEDKERKRDGQRGRWRSGGAWKSNGRTKCTNSMKLRSDTVHHRLDLIMRCALMNSQ